MFGELITLPLRAPGVAVRLWWRAAGRAMSLSLSAAGYLAERVSPGDSPPRETESRSHATARGASPVPSSSPNSSTSSKTSRKQPPPVEPQTVPRATEPQPVAPAEEPAHLSEEPTLVEEF